MGWDGTRPVNYYKNGNVNRKAELDSRYTWNDDNQINSVVKSVMVGTTYYGAIKVHKIKDNSDVIVGVAALTRMDDGWLMVKTMEETVMPYYFDCPNSILDLLSETDNKYANEWRNKCRLSNSKPKINKLKVGSTIRFACPYDTKYYKQGDIVELTKTTIYKTYKRTINKWVSDNRITWKTSMIPYDFEIIN